MLHLTGGLLVLASAYLLTRNFVMNGQAFWLPAAGLVVGVLAVVCGGWPAWRTVGRKVPLPRRVAWTRGRGEKADRTHHRGSTRDC
ncbi:MAG: hypothetical protein D6746_11365 [Bacteroidetes bacterium]|nr:MAG: hypothetical protein D6746_11365 [Bacteroidota bacterium]